MSVKQVYITSFRSIVFLTMLLGVLQVQAQQADRKSERAAREMAWEGNKLYNEELFDEAEIFYHKSLEESYNMPESSFNLGNTTYQLGRHDEAARRFKELAETESLSPQQRSDAYYNLGNSLIKTQDFENAVEAYKNSLRLEPGDEDARHNLSMAMQMLQKQQQEQQQQQQQQQNQDQNQQQDPNQQQEAEQDEDGDQGEEEQQQEGGEDQQPGDQQDNPQQGEGEGEPREMTQEEMERILRALEQDEKETQKKVNAQRAKTQRGDDEKDW